MGVPSFFKKISDAYNASFIPIKNINTGDSIDVFYMDANSTIYDIVNEMTDNEKTEINDTPDIEHQIFLQTAKRIENYILAVKPIYDVYIAFDGIAPIAKMEQQRSRRYRSSIISKIAKTLNIENATNKFSITNITPGTGFMKRFASFIDNYFNEIEIYNKQNELLNIRVSTSEFIGEGEHKIFNHIRKTDNSAKNIVLYGLDADLIVLSLFNLSYCKNIFLIRDKIDYTNTAVKDPYSAEMVCIDMNILSKLMADDIRGLSPQNNKEFERPNESDMNIVYDYLFLCFFLGNDFLPHNPVLNVRTNGMQILKDLYRLNIYPYKDRNLIKSGNVEWRWVSLIIKELSKIERSVLLKEYEVRDNIARSVIRNNTQDDIDNIPILFRAAEHYINPASFGWEERYTKSLFGLMNDGGDKRAFKQRLKHVVNIACDNYLEGLEWVYRYYTGDCVDWQWKYCYNYPPLFSDLYAYVPKMNVQLLEPTERLPVSQDVQLLYVMNPNNYERYGISPKVISRMKEMYPEIFVKRTDLSVAFCRYLWEAHPVIPEITLEMVKEMLKIV